MLAHIHCVHHEDPAVQRQLLDYLAPHEATCLFLTSNLKGKTPQSYFYVAEKGNRWRAVAQYFGVPKSLVVFAEDPAVIRPLVREVVSRHTPIKFLHGAASTAEVAFDELRQHGYSLSESPRQILMQRDGLPADQPHEQLVRAATQADHEALALLMRYLSGRPQDEPVEADEMLRFQRERYRLVLEMDGQIVSTASTNEAGVAAFQILGVATHEQHRGQGYAAAVCAALSRLMAAEGIHRSVLFTDMQNTAAQRCYARLGFQPIGEYWFGNLTRNGGPDE